MGDTSYSARASMAGKTTIYTLEDTAITWQKEGGEGGRMSYADIASIQLISYAVMGGTGLQCTIKSRSGAKLKIRSQHFVGFGKLEDRSAAYGPFVRALTARVGAAAPDARFVAGSNALWFTWLVIGIAAVAILGLLGIAVAMGERLSISTTGIAPLLVLVLLAPVIVREMRKGRAKAFDPANPPAALAGDAPSAAMSASR